ncbi:MAG TPA: arginyltransferase [Stellaceae bacterium]|nr:arginyltransferase [Stellaceae bacterium]
MRVKVEQDVPDGNGTSLLRSRRSGPGLPPVASALRPFYRTASLPCPYLDGKTERKLITEISGHDSYAFYNELSRAGFRRSHHLAYRPACAGCAACLPVRVNVEKFEISRSLRRTMIANRDLAPRLMPARATTEQYRVFSRYQRSRHAESDMASMTYGDYRAMVEDSPVMTVMQEHRKPDGTLVAACLADLLDDGLSAVYSFYDPAESARSPGTAVILALIAEARKRALPYVYLGYWIGASRKMAYKTRFRPLEALTSQGWAPLSQ